MDLKETLTTYLRSQREVVLWKLEALSERDLRTPLTPTGTNLLGLVKHLAGVEAEYFGECIGRPWPEWLPWWDEDAEPNADMWATAEESPEEILDLYRRVQAHADAAIAELPLDAPATVPWWDPQETTLGRIVVHMIAETARHAGHLDILRERIDGAHGLLRAIPNMPPVDEVWWEDYVAELREIADAADRSDGSAR